MVAALGRLGAATTAGLILGPAIGGWLAHLGGNRLLGLTAAAVAALGALWIALAVPGVPPPRPLSRPPQRGLWPDLSVLRAAPGLRPLFALAVAVFFALVCVEGTFGRLLHHRFGYGPREFGLIFGYESLLSVLVQTVMLAWLASRVRAPRLLAPAYGLQRVGLALTPFAPGLAALFALSPVYALGVGVATPTLNGLCSAGTPPARQGEMFGLLQGARSAGFLIGPTLGSVLFDWNVEAPYLLAGTVLLLGGGAWAVVTERHSHEHTHEPLVHTHRYVHDAHHQHAHLEGVDPAEPHTHGHVHERLTHTHRHYPDLHHRHGHGR